jgi:hypothetical protein
MARQVFFSFHYVPDSWRVSQIRNIGMVEGNPPARDNEWEQITRGGDAAIQRWIDGQLKGRSCTIVMIGAATAQRKWIDYEIGHSWNNGKGVVGIHIHNLRDVQQRQAPKGANPFSHFTMDRDRSRSLASIVKAYDPPFSDSRQVYAFISARMEGWIDEAIRIRQNWGN